MTPTRAPTVRQQRLGIELRRLREAKDLTADEIADRLEWSPSKVSRIENARIGVRVSDVRLLLELYDVEESHRGEVLALAQVASKKGWWASRADLLDRDLVIFIALEDEADSARYCETQMMPGIIQTEEYARHVIASWDLIQPASRQTIAHRVEVRMRRQRLLTKPNPLQISVLIDEAVLLRCVGDPGTMYRQLMYIAELSRRPNVALRLLPLNVPRQPVIGESFILLDFSPAYEVEFPDVVHVEGVLAAHTQDDSLTHIYRLMWDQLLDSALDPDPSLKLISRIARERWR